MEWGFDNMQFSIPTKDGSTIFSPHMDKAVLKYALKVLIKTGNKGIVRQAVYSSLYPRLYNKFTTR